MSKKPYSTFVEFSHSLEISRININYFPLISLGFPSVPYRFIFVYSTIDRVLLACSRSCRCSPEKSIKKKTPNRPLFSRIPTTV